MAIYKQVKQDHQTCTIHETQIHGREASRKVIKEDPQIKFKKATRPKRTEADKQLQSQKMKEIWP